MALSCTKCRELIEHGAQWQGDDGSPYCSLDCLEADGGREDIIEHDRRMDPRRRDRARIARRDW